MQKYFAEGTFYNLPSGNKFHPQRLIIRDGTLTWRDALACEGVVHIPQDLAHEQHIIKTAQRVEELNSWCSQSMELWHCIKPLAWFKPDVKELSEGICLYFEHTVLRTKTAYAKLIPHIKDHEELEVRDNCLLFKRC